jgi:hypothetical protein
MVILFYVWILLLSSIVTILTLVYFIKPRVNRFGWRKSAAADTGDVAVNENHDILEPVVKDNSLFISRLKKLIAKKEPKTISLQEEIRQAKSKLAKNEKPEAPEKKEKKPLKLQFKKTKAVEKKSPAVKKEAEKTDETAPVQAAAVKKEETKEVEAVKPAAAAPAASAPAATTAAPAAATAADNKTPETAAAAKPSEPKIEAAEFVPLVVKADAADVAKAKAILMAQFPTPPPSAVPAAAPANAAAGTAGAAPGAPGAVAVPKAAPVAAKPAPPKPAPAKKPPEQKSSLADLSKMFSKEAADDSEATKLAKEMKEVEIDNLVKDSQDLISMLKRGRS